MVLDNYAAVETVLDQLRNGERNALKSIYQIYWEGLIRACAKVVPDVDECEDMVQEVFVTLWEKREHLEIEKDLGAYLHGVLRFKIFNYLRKHQRRSAVYTKFAHAIQQEGAMDLTPEHAYLEKQVYNSVLNAIAELPEKCKLVYQLREEDNMSYQDIAANLGISVKTVETQLLKARKQLRFSLRQFLALLIACSMYLLF